jgi:hypothetical protein
MVDGICYVQTRQDSNPIVGQMGIAVEGAKGIRSGLTNEESDRTHPSRGDLIPGLTFPSLENYGPKMRHFEIYRRGTAAFTWNVTVPFEWIKATPSSGTLDSGTNDARVYIEVDWDRAPPDIDQTMQIIVSSTVGDCEHVHLPVIRRHLPTGSFTGFVESDGCVSVPATRLSRPQAGSQYQIFPFLGRTEFGVVGTGHATKHWTYEVMIDDKSYGDLRLIQDPAKIGELPPGWDKAVQDCVWTQTLDLHEPMRSGKHVIKVCLCKQNLLLEKLVLDLGGVRESYLGPPASTFVN